MTLLICRTCPRYDLRTTGGFATEFRAALDNAVAERGAPIAIRGVVCLGGCPRDGVAALDDAGKARVRFTGISADLAPALVAAASAYDECASGHPNDWQIPTELDDKLSSVTLKRMPSVASSSATTASRS